MKFERTLDAYINAEYRLALGRPGLPFNMDPWAADRKLERLARQRDAFRARLVKMYRHADQEARFLAELLTVCRDPLPRG